MLIEFDVILLKDVGKSDLRWRESRAVPRHDALDLRP